MSSQHTATFTWPMDNAQTVIVTGSFDNWSGSTHHLKRVESSAEETHGVTVGGFKGEVQIPWGEKVAYKYVVDGQWMTREDEAKEWDAAGNMNNVYTAPAAPVAPEHHQSNAAAAATSAPSTVPESTTADPAVSREANLADEHKTEPNSLVSSGVPAGAGALAAVGAAGAAGAAAHSSNKEVAQERSVDTAAGASGQSGLVESENKERPVSQLYGMELGKPLGSTGGAQTSTATTGVTSSHPAAATTTSSTTAVTSAPSEGPTVPSSEPVLAANAATTPTNANSADPAAPLKGIASMFTAPSTTPDKAEQAADPAAPLKGIASNFKAPSDDATTTLPAANGTAAPSSGAAGYGAAAIAAMTTAASGLVIGVNDAVHAVTGVDLVHPNPVSVEEAKARGIDTSALPKVDGAAHAPSAELPPAPANGTAGSLSKELPSKPIAQDSIMATSNAQPASSQAAGVIPATSLVNSGSNSTSTPGHTSVNGLNQAGTASKPSASAAPDVFSSNVTKPADNSTIAANEPSSVPKSTHDVPAQHETKDANHKHIPQPVITSIGENTKDRTKPSSADNRTQPISDNPGISAKTEKEKAEGGIDGLPSRSYIKKSPAGKDLATAGGGLPLSASTVPTSGAEAVPPATPAKTAAAVPAATVAGPDGVKPAEVPGTPVNKFVAENRKSVIGSPSSSAQSSPQKLKDQSNDAMRKRKSSFFAKVKGVFHKKGSTEP